MGRRLAGLAELSVSELKSDIRFAFLAWLLGSATLLAVTGLVIWALRLRVEW